MSQITVMSVVSLVQADKLQEAARLLYNQPIAVACDLLAKSIDLLSKEEWKALQQTLHIPATRTIIIPRLKPSEGGINIEPYAAS